MRVCRKCHNPFCRRDCDGGGPTIQHYLKAFGEGDRLDDFDKWFVIIWGLFFLAIMFAAFAAGV